MAMETVRVPLSDLTPEALLIHVAGQVDDLTTVVKRMEKKMADLTSSVEALQGAVDNMAVRFASQIVPLTEALAAAQAEVDALEVSSEADKAALTEALANASAAAEAINAEVAELNSIGAEPDVPVEPVPVEDLPPAPSEDSPAEDVPPAEETPADAPAEGDATA